MTGQADYFMNLMKFHDEHDLSVILPNKLFLSGRSVPQNPSLLIKNNITHVLSVTRMKVKAFDSVTYKWLDLDDLSQVELHKYFDEAHEFIDSGVNGEGACLVHCDAGVSRSSTMVISYLMRKQKLQLLDAYKFVRERRPIISPNFGFIKQLVSFERLLFPDCDSMAFEVFYTRINMFHDRPDIPDEEIREALFEAEHNIHRAIHILEKKRPYQDFITGLSK